MLFFFNKRNICLEANSFCSFLFHRKTIIRNSIEMQIYILHCFFPSKFMINQLKYWKMCRFLKYSSERFETKPYMKVVERNLEFNCSPSRFDIIFSLTFITIWLYASVKLTGLTITYQNSFHFVETVNSFVVSWDWNEKVQKAIKKHRWKIKCFLMRYCVVFRSFVR